MLRATIDHVAKLAGVSMKTVSRVVNREPNVRESTKKKVEAAISKQEMLELAFELHAAQQAH